MKTADKSLWAAVLAASSSLAQTGPARAITLVEGRGELLQFQRDVQKVALAEPKIADAVVLSPREVMVNAKTPGHTTLLIWETGSDPARHEIEVAKDNSDWDSFRKLIEDSANGAVTGSGGTGTEQFTPPRFTAISSAAPKPRSFSRTARVSRLPA